MKIGLVDVDSKIPNLALMKISAYHKACSDDVEWYSPLFDECDIIYLSKIFSFTKDYRYQLNGKEIVKGGTGYSLNLNLTIPMENKNPDYSIYPNNEYDIGYISRGCIRKCKFCVVPEKEGNIHQIAEPEDIYSGLHKKIMFLDNNFTALADRINLLKRIIKMQQEYNVKITFKQGLDIRLFDEEFTSYLNQIKYDKNIIIAYDEMKYQKQIEKKLKETIKIINPKKIMCYVLFNYDTTKEEDLYRINFLTNLKIKPYVMPYKKGKYANDLCNYINSPYGLYNVMSFKKYLILRNIIRKKYKSNMNISKKEFYKIEYEKYLKQNINITKVI